MSAVFAATYPERTAALVMYGTYAKWIRDADYPWAPTREEHEGAIAACRDGWGTPVTATVKDLVAGSGLRFADRGAHALKGVAGDWRLFAVQI
jgi:hypothetical protein